MENDSSWEKALKLIGKRKGEQDATIRLIRKLKIIQFSRIQYNRNIEEENNFVILSQESIFADSKETDETTFEAILKDQKCRTVNIQKNSLKEIETKLDNN